MTTLLLTLLAFLMFPWVFWTLAVGLVFGAYKVVTTEDDFPWGATVLVGLLIAGLVYRYDSFRAALVSWPSVAYLIGGYVGVGVLVAGYKWLMVLVDFRPKARAWLEANPGAIMSSNHLSKAEHLSHHVYGGYHLKVSVSGPRNPDTVGDSYYPRWQAFPLTNWWVFWPLFSVSVVLDPIWRAAKRAVKWAGLALERVAKQFAVS